MNYIKIAAGVYAANCYIIYSREELKGIILDPGGDVDIILEQIHEKNIDIEYIVLTHGHGDHIGGVKGLKDKLQVPLLIHQGDVDLLKDARMNLSNIMPSGAVELVADRLIEDGEILSFGDLEAEIIHTPGHTRGCICVKVGDHLFTGDTLFEASIGRTDLDGGDYNTIIDSIKTKLLPLPDNTVVLPGHGGASSIGREKKINPYIK